MDPRVGGFDELRMKSLEWTVPRGRTGGRRTSTRLNQLDRNRDRFPLSRPLTKGILVIGLAANQGRLEQS
jgi:hypothetical protein